MSQLHRQASMCVQKRVSPNTGGNCLQVECRSCGCDQPVRPATRSLQNVNLSWSAKSEASWMLKNGDRSAGKPESARRFCHALRSEAGGAFDISTRGGAKLAKAPTYPRDVT